MTKRLNTMAAPEDILDQVLAGTSTERVLTQEEIDAIVEDLAKTIQPSREIVSMEMSTEAILSQGEINKLIKKVTRQMKRKEVNETIARDIVKDRILSQKEINVLIGDIIVTLERKEAS